LEVNDVSEIPEMDYSSMSTEDLKRLEAEYETDYIRYNIFQLAEKNLLNSLYGALGAQAFRYYDLALAESVTNSGKLSIKWIERKLNEKINDVTGEEKDRVVLIDTDSTVLDLYDVVKKFCPESASRVEKLEYINRLGEKVINPYIDKSYKELADYMNAYEQKMQMKRENVINTMVSCAAKSYVMEVFDSEGVRYTLEDPYMKIMGLAMVKSSTPKIVRQALRDCTKILLHGTEREMQEAVKKMKKEFMKHTVEEIAFPRGVSNMGIFSLDYWQERYRLAESEEEKKNILETKINGASEYCVKGTPFHVKASWLFNNLVDKHGLGNVYKKIEDGEKIRFVYLKPNNPTKEQAIAFQDRLPEEFGLHKYVDYDVMFAKAFESALESMTDALGWSIHPKNTLDDFFV